MNFASTPVVDPISAEVAAEHLAGGALIVDLRPQVARHEGSIPGALVIDTDELHAALAPNSPCKVDAACNLDVEIDVVFIGGRSRILAERIAELGYRNVRWVAGGFAAWRSAGLPVGQ